MNMIEYAVSSKRKQSKHMRGYALGGAGTAKRRSVWVGLELFFVSFFSFKKKERKR